MTIEEAMQRIRRDSDAELAKTVSMRLRAAGIVYSRQVAKYAHANNLDECTAREEWEDLMSRTPDYEYD